MKNKRKIGNKYEDMAAEKLIRDGCVIVERNFLCKFGEIDIIAEDRGVIIFAEVKYRKDFESGYPEEAVTISKQRRISRTADYYCLVNNISYDSDFRFDVIAVDEKGLRHYRNAFAYCGSGH